MQEYRFTDNDVEFVLENLQLDQYDHLVCKLKMDNQCFNSELSEHSKTMSLGEINFGGKTQIKLPDNIFNELDALKSRLITEKSDLIKKTAKAIAAGEMLIDITVDTSPLHYHPWLSELRGSFNNKSPIYLDAQLVLDEAVLSYSKRGTLRLSGENVLENALNGNVKQLKKDIGKHAIDLVFDENNIMISFKIKLEDITVINIMKIL
ncbi:hypothetical protein [Acetobacterium tundrae]|uniref:Uncharacterized protein n=1 Tax=Acetobacterium tundrae TaxID=132932 RepID=A0ABR6WND0_9FIRM|nr:hypothetical protein [Acetobacterium tundrae]MBC3797941.1 hypothetical protein [Acetobacterium tundrae]